MQPTTHTYTRHNSSPPTLSKCPHHHSTNKRRIIQASRILSAPSFDFYKNQQTLNTQKTKKKYENELLLLFTLQVLFTLFYDFVFKNKPLKKNAALSRGFLSKIYIHNFFLFTVSCQAVDWGAVIGRCLYASLASYMINRLQHSTKNNGKFDRKKSRFHTYIYSSNLHHSSIDDVRAQGLNTSNG